MRVINVYQPINPTFSVNENVKEYDPNDYKLVWKATGNTLYPDKSIEDVAEQIFMLSNHARINDWKGYSMSTGDIINIDGNMLICCDVGWMPVSWKGEK